MNFAMSGFEIILTSAKIVYNYNTHQNLSILVYFDGFEKYIKLIPERCGQAIYDSLM